MGKLLMSRGLTSNSTTKNQSNEIHKTGENTEPTWQTKIQRAAVQFSNTFVGKTMMKQFIKLLWTLEKTARWISNDNDNKVKADGKRVKVPASLVRPLPWVFFLPTLIALRFTRVMLSLISISIGFGYIEASMMIAFLHETRHKMQHVLFEADQNKHQETNIHHDEHNIPSFISNTSNMISQISDTIKTTHSNKISLKTFHEGDDPNSTNSEDSDVEEKIYQDFLTRPIFTSDSDDDDFVCGPNGEDVSDTDSQSSIATDDLSDGNANDENKTQQTNSNEVTEEAKPNAEIGTNGDTKIIDEDTCTTVDQTIEDIQVYDIQSPDVKPSSENNVDNNADRIMTEATKALEEKGVTHNRQKNVNRQQKNGGRSHAKNQNNCKQYNGGNGQAQNKSKTVKHHHIETTTDFISEAATSDRC